MKNQIITLECLDLSAEAYGICKHDGLVVFVKGLLPGEKAEVKIIAEKKNYSIGIISRLLVPSVSRVESDCPVAYKCGGCDLRHLDYDSQLVFKKNMLKNIFTKYDYSITINDVTGADNPYHYRNKIQLPVRNHLFGFYRKNTNDIVEVDNCLLESEDANEIIAFLKKELLKNNIDIYFRHLLIKHVRSTGEIMLGMIVNTFNLPGIDVITEKLVKEFPLIKTVILNLNKRNDNVILGDEEKILYGSGYIVDEFAGFKVKISLKSFYQVNHDQMLKLYQTVVDLGQLNRDMKVLDLFSGIGTIFLFVSPYVKEVTGVEIIGAAVNNALENVKLNNLHNVNFYLDDANGTLDKYFVNQDLVIVDPPRKGLGKDLIQSLIKNNVKKIVYVSCNPLTLARDLDLFKNDYSFSAIQPVDMFPFTCHVETVCLLVRKNDLDIDPDVDVEETDKEKYEKECVMNKIIAVYEGPYVGFELSHGYHIETYTIKKRSSGDYEIYVQEGDRVAGGAFTTVLYKNKIEGKTYEEVVEMLPESYLLKDVLLGDEMLKRFLGFI